MREVTISLEQAILIAARRLGLVEVVNDEPGRVGYYDGRDQYNLDSLYEAARQHDPRIFEVFECVERDAQEIAWVYHAERDRHEKDGFWSLDFWGNVSDWNTATRAVCKSKYTVLEPKEIDMSERDAGYVYLISCNEGYTKIGRSKNPQMRIGGFSLVPPFSFEIVHTFPCDRAADAEFGLHRRYADYRLRGEWFNLAQDEIAKLKAITEYRLGEFHTEQGIMEVGG